MRSVVPSRAGRGVVAAIARPGVLLLLVALCSCRSLPSHRALERIIIAPDGRGFVTERSRQPFRPWGLNYGNAGRLMEDFWDDDWQTFEDDFREMKQLGANVVRVHLQYGTFMDAVDRPNPRAMKQLARMLRLAEDTGLHLDITGLACYRPADMPAWYNDLDEPARWTAQANFWETIARACAGSPAVFCYDLMNEPVSPASKREPGRWMSGNLFGGYDFVQFIALDPAGRTREQIANQWIHRMTEAIRKHDSRTLITVGIIPWSHKWKHLSGFLPASLATNVDFFSVHIYPDRERPDEAMESLRQYDVGRPVVIEETFLLSCDSAQLEKFFRDSRQIACGWIGHYDGQTIAEADARERAGKLSMHDAIYREWLRLFTRLAPEFKAGEPARPPPP